MNLLPLEKMKMIIKELKLCSKSEDLTVLKKYIDLWDPVRFVTQNEVEKIIEEKIEEMK